MLLILASMLGGWILSLFGFKAVVITGMAQVFGVSLTSTGYYFLFALKGMLCQVFAFGRKTINGSNPLNEGVLAKSLKKAFDKENKRKGR
jgi:hypothetical protein